MLKKITQRLSSLKIVSSEILSYTAVGYWCQWDSNPSTLIILLESIHMQENGLSGSLNIPTGHTGAKIYNKISRFDKVKRDISSQTQEPRWLWRPQ
jgi:hypothetical protein